MNIFNYLDYKACIKELFEAEKMIRPELTYAKVAESMNIQKAYLSKVLNQEAHLSQDQLFLFCESFSLEPEEREFLGLLLERQRTGLESRFAELDSRINQIQRAHRVTEKHIDSKPLQANLEQARDYYLDAFNQLIHVCLSNEEFCASPLEFSDRLGLSKQRLQSVLTELQRLNVIEITKQGIQVLQKGLHLSKQEKVFPAWRLQTRTMANQRLQQQSSPDDYNLTVFFSTEGEKRKAIQEEFFKFLEKAQKLSKDTEAEGVYQMNFDLIAWLS